MAVQIIKTTFQLKRGTAARWRELNPVLRQGEPGFEFDTGKLKIGDGLTAYNDLKYQTSKDYIVNQPTSATFPLIGEKDVIYKAENERMLYQWNESINNYEPLNFIDLTEINASIASLQKKDEEIEKTILDLIKGASIEGNLLEIVDNFIEIPLANYIQAGVVKSSDSVNKIQVEKDGTMTVHSLGISKLVQEDDITIVLDSGDASL